MTEDDDSRDPRPDDRSEADALDQTTRGPAETTSPSDPEVPEADALEQHPKAPKPEAPAEPVPEADALDQEREA